MDRSRNSSKQTSALSGLGYFGAGAGQGVICLPEDKSFGCELNRIIGTIQGFAFLILFAFLVFWVFKNRKTLFTMKTKT